MLIEKEFYPNRGVQHVITREDEDGIFHAFIKELEPVKHICLDNFYANINSLEVEKVYSSKEMPDPTMAASYEIFDNKLRYIVGMYLYTIDHELLHLATRVETEKYIHCGFCQLDKSTQTRFGIGLDEGYTVVLDERYFKDRATGKKDYIVSTYPITRFLASNLEELIGQEIMEKLYFDADLGSLIDEMAKYCHVQRCVQFIADLDIIHSVNRKIALTNYQYAQVKHAIEDAISVLTEMALYNVYYNYEMGYISLKSLADIAMSIRDYSKMCLSVVGAANGKKKFTTTPMSDDEFFKLCKYSSKSAKKNALL